MKKLERHRYPPAGTVARFPAAARHVRRHAGPGLRKRGVRYIPMVISGLIGNALRSAVAGACEAA